MINTKKHIIISVIMSAIIFAVALTVIFMNDFKGNVAAVPGEVSGGVILDLGENDNQSVSFDVITIPKAQYIDYGISPIAEAAQQITATVTPASAEYKTLDWSVAWESGTSGKFGNGKNVTDYVTVTPISDGALTATLTCKQAFGETIILTASLRLNPAIKGSRKIQYRQKATKLSSSTFVCHDSTLSEREFTWDFPAVDLYSSLSYAASASAASVSLDFPIYAGDDTFNKYRLSFLNSSYSYPIPNPSYATTYTKTASFGKVDMYVIDDATSSGSYRDTVSTGSISVSDSYDETVGLKVGSTALPVFDFFMLGSSDGTGYMASFRKNLVTFQRSAGYLFSVYFTCTVNDEIMYSQRIHVSFNVESLATIPSSIDIGSDDIYY